MYETTDDLAAFQALLDDSLERAGEHLRSISTPGERTPSAHQIVDELAGMRTVVVSTVSAAGAPRTSAVDGHFLRAEWVFTTSGDSYKARDLKERPLISAAYVDQERFAVFTHGRAEFLDREHVDWEPIEAHLCAHYGQSPLTWGPSIIYVRIKPTFCVAYASDPSQIGRAAGLT